MCDLVDIRLACLDDLEEMNLLFRKVIDDLEFIKEINMWNDVYPFCEFEGDIKNRRMYAIERQNKIIGSFTIDDYDDPDCRVINWNAKSKRWFYLSRLVILTSEQGNGYAKIAMKFVEEYAINNNYEVIRLTVYDKNKDAIGLYERIGFKKVEDSNMIIQGKEFIGFEKNINH